tara:strand:- start:2452 stop:3261 length:810 start_codon:yes stop_codon:yes gene_type:complete
MKVYCNGEIIDKDKVSEVFEPGFLFGWGVFEPFRVYGDNITFLSEHINRLNMGLEILGIEAIEIDWEKSIRELISTNSIKDAYIRITAYKKRKGTGILIYADSFGYYTQEVFEKGFSTLISSYLRNIDEVASQVKSLSYLQNRLSWFQAQKAKKDEALILNEKGDLVGGSRSNLFLIKDERLITPNIESGVFEGITRKVVLSIAEEMNLEIEEREISLEDLATANEAFITSALLETMPLVECEDEPIGSGKPGKITLEILSEYRKIVKP